MSYSISVGMWESGTDYNANTSNISFNIYLSSTNGQSYSGYPNMSVDFNIGGQGGSVGVASAASCAGGATPVIASGTVTIRHDSNGYLGTVGGSFHLNGSGGYAPPSLDTSGSCGTTDFDYRPGVPSFTSISRATGTSRFDISMSSVSSPAPGLAYYTQYSQNSGGWTGTQGGQSTSFYLSAGSNYQFRCYAVNNDGGPRDYSYSGVYYAPTVPGAPSSIGVSTPSGLALTVTAGNSSDGGSGITGYYVQASSDNGTTWGSALAMTAQQYNFTGLLGGSNYKFRVYSTNEMGAGAFTTSSTVFVPSGGKRWNGTSFVPTATAKRFDGTNFVNITTAKRFDGTNWLNLS